MSSSIGFFEIGVSAIGVGASPAGYQQITDWSAGAQHLEMPDGVAAALLAAENAIVRYRDDGAAPTIDAGFPLFPGCPRWYVGNLESLQFIGSAFGAVLDVLYYAGKAP